MKICPPQQNETKSKGFSLVEIVVIIAIMIVLLAILTPSILRYVENSRMQKDDSAMDEVCHGILYALSDSEIFDEAVSYSIPNNYVTYTDSSGVYGAKYTDEEFWAPDGSGEAVTITFNPDENGTYVLANGLVNDMTYGNGSVADSRTAEDVKQCYFSEMGQQKLYHKVEQTIGSTFSEKSATYNNSSYTVFITFDVVNGIKRADVYGEWNGTNLDPSCPASLGSGTNSYTEEEEPEQTKTGGTTQSNFTSSDLQGGGGTSGNIPSYKQDDLPCGHKPSTPGDHDKLPCNHYACRCDCAPPPCGVEGHWPGDGMNHEKLECGHFGCQCSGCIIPAGGKYTTVDGTVYGPGDSFPYPAQMGDKYTYGNYEYKYKQYFDVQWKNKDSQIGWGVHCLKNMTDPGPILNNINKEPVTTMQSTFYNCPKLTVAPVIPHTITNMNCAFLGCKDLKTAPVIPDNVSILYNTFWGCSSLTGDIVINTNTTSYSNCFASVNYEQQKITLTGTSPILDTIGIKTGLDYCVECNGYCRSDRVKVPEGGNYYVGITSKSAGSYSGYTEKQTGGQSFPATIKNGDIYTYGDYEYRYNQYFDVQWKDNPNQNGWGVRCMQNVAEPGAILDSVYGQPVTTLQSTFSGRSNMKIAPVIPESVTNINCAFLSCSALERAPVIHENISILYNAFWGCKSLTGDIVINTNTTAYSNCFASVDFSTQNITLKGSSSNLDNIGKTGVNYCMTCNGTCKNNH